MNRGPMGETGRRSRRGWIVVGVVAAAFIALVAFAQSQRNGNEVAVNRTIPAGSQPESSSPTGPTGPADDELWVVRRDPGDPLAMGDVNAPVVLVEWLDVRCPFCALFSRQTLPTLVDEYIDAGLVRYEVHTVEFFGDQSGAAAVAVAAAGEQGLALEYLDAVYAATPERGQPDLDRDVLIEFADQVGIPDIGRFRSDLDRDDLRGAVDEQTAVAGSIGINTVPFFLVGDLAIAGAQPVEVFRDVLDDAIAAAGT